MATAALVPSSPLATTPLSAAWSIGSFGTREVVPKEEIHEQKTRKLQTSLVRFSRLNDRKMTLRTLEQASFLKCLELDAVDQSDYSSFDLETEIINQTTLNVNGMQFVQQGEGGKQTKEGLAMLRMLCARLCEDKKIKVNPRAMYKEMIPKMAPSTASADPYFRLNSLLGSSDLLVMPMTQNQVTPIEVKLFASNESVHMRLTAKFHFGLFRKIDVKYNNPWIVVQAQVTERANFGNGKSARFLSLSVSDMKH